MATTGHRRCLVWMMLLPSCFDPTHVENAGSTTGGSSGDSTTAPTTGATTSPTSSATSASTTPTTSDTNAESGPGSADDTSTSAATDSVGATEDESTGPIEGCNPDGTIQGDEACDDGNTDAGDGCSDCTIEAGYVCDGEPSVCGVTCDPLLQDCIRGHGCYPVAEAWICALDASDGAGVQDEECMFVNGCAPGLVCADGMNLPGCPGANCCTAVCDLTAPACITGYQCVEWYGAGMAPAGYEDVGVCAG